MVMKVGDVYESKNWGSVSLVGVGKDVVTVMFTLSGNVQEVKKGTLSSGQFQDKKAYEVKFGKPIRERGSMSVGDIFPSDYWGDMRVVSIASHRETAVEFLLSGNLCTVKQKEIVAGKVADSESRLSGGKMVGFESPKRKAAKIPAGVIFKSNFWGDVEVIEYRSSTDIDVKFIESGNAVNVQKHALESGLVKDIARQMQETSKKNDAAKAEARDKAESVVAESIARKIADENRRIETKLAKEEAKRKAIEEYEYNLKQEVYSSVDFGDYSIVNILSGGLYEILFKDTGNTETYGLREIRRCAVKDTKRYTDAQWSAIQKEKAAAYYARDRENRLQKAKVYQKANPEKARNFNRRRRARRMGAEGSFEHHEIEDMLVAQNNKCACCGVDLDEGKHLDHIMPLALGGTNYIENLQWLCPFCNISKSDKHPDVWAQQILTQGFQDRCVGMTI